MPFKKLKRFFISSLPVKTVVSGSKSIYLPGLSGFSLFEIWNAFVAQLRKNSLTERAAAISYNMVMAIPPTLVFVFTLIPYLPISRQFIQELYVLIRDVVPGKENNTVIIGF